MDMRQQPAEVPSRLGCSAAMPQQPPATPEGAPTAQRWSAAKDRRGGRGRAARGAAGRRYGRLFRKLVEKPRRDSLLLSAWGST